MIGAHLAFLSGAHGGMLGSALSWTPVRDGVPQAAQALQGCTVHEPEDEPETEGRGARQRTAKVTIPGSSLPVAGGQTVLPEDGDLLEVPAYGKLYVSRVEPSIANGSIWEVSVFVAVK